MLYNSATISLVAIGEDSNPEAKPNRAESTSRVNGVVITRAYNLTLNWRITSFGTFCRVSTPYLIKFPEVSKSLLWLTSICFKDLYILDLFVYKYACRKTLKCLVYVEFVDGLKRLLPQKWWISADLRWRPLFSQLETLIMAHLF